MKTALALLAAVIVLNGCANLDPKVSLQPPPNVPKQMVGGVCEYDEYVGTCAFTGPVTYKYKSTVDGKDVVLNENKVSGEIKGGAKVGDTFGCKLNFIINGTCTPCLFTSQIFMTGECGNDAWELFRKR